MKKPNDRYLFRIDSMRPETLPMARLIQYLTELVVLFGSREHVHFMEVQEGSAMPAIVVDPQAEPKVRARLQLVHDVDPPKDLQCAISILNKLLRDDNATGELRAPGGAQIIQFPGRLEQLPQEAHITEMGSLEGQIVRLGGKDETAHAVIEVEPGYWEKFKLTRALARDLAPFLYGEAVRVYGKGHWRRSPEGDWTLEWFNADRFETLSGEVLSEVLSDLAGLRGNGWLDSDDPLGELHRLRRGFE